MQTSTDMTPSSQWCSQVPHTGCGEVRVSRRLLHQHFSVGQCPSLQSTSIQRGHRSQPPLVTLTSSLAGLNIRRGSSEACVSVLHSAGSFLGDVRYNSFWCNDEAENGKMIANNVFEIVYCLSMYIFFLNV